MQWAPGIQDQRGQIIMQGNQMAQQQGQQMAQVGEYFVDRANKAKSLRAVLKAYNPDAGAAADSMGLDELQGTFQGLQAKQQSDLMAARLADYGAQAQLRQQQAQDDQSIGNFVQQFYSAPDVPTPLSKDDNAGEGPMTTRPPTSTERFHYAASQTPVAGRAVPRLLEALTKYGQATDDETPIVLKDNPYPGVSVVTTKSGRGGVHVVQNPNAGPQDQPLAPVYTEDPVTGARALLYGKSAQSTGFNPAKAAPQLMPQHDADGNLVGWSQLDARGRATFIPNKTTAVLKTATDENGDPIAGYYIDAQGKLHDTRSALEKSLGTAGATKAAGQPAAGAGAGKAAPYKSPADVVTAFKAGKLPRADAAKILNEQFGVPLK